VTGANGLPTDVLLIVNHGRWTRDEVGPPGAGGSGSAAEAALPPAADFAWRLFFFDPSTKHIAGLIAAPDNECFRG